MSLDSLKFIQKKLTFAFVANFCRDAVLCYASQPGGASPWQMLPRHVHAVTGWDAATGRTYFQDEPEHSIVYSVDGGLTFSPVSLVRAFGVYMSHDICA